MGLNAGLILLMIYGNKVYYWNVPMSVFVVCAVLHLFGWIIDQMHKESVNKNLFKIQEKLK